jgi:cell division septation protein DedD
VLNPPNYCQALPLPSIKDEEEEEGIDLDAMEDAMSAGCSEEDEDDWAPPLSQRQPHPRQAKSAAITNLFRLGRAEEENDEDDEDVQEVQDVIAIDEEDASGEVEATPTSAPPTTALPTTALPTTTPPITAPHTTAPAPPTRPNSPEHNDEVGNISESLSLQLSIDDFTTDVWAQRRNVFFEL